MIVTLPVVIPHFISAARSRERENTSLSLFCVKMKTSEGDMRTVDVSHTERKRRSHNRSISVRSAELKTDALDSSHLCDKMFMQTLVIVMNKV